MASAFLYFAGGGDEQDRIEKSVRVSCAGGINIGFSLLAFVSVVIVCRYIGLYDSAPALMTWIAALAVGIFYFFTLRLIYGSVFSFDDQADGKITFSALQRRIPHILGVMMLSIFIANTLAIELSKKEIDSNLQVMQFKYITAARESVDQKEVTGSGPMFAGYMTRIDLAHHLNPEASALIGMIFVFAGAGPLLVVYRRKKS